MVDSKKHHYVSQWFQKSFCNNKDKLFCLRYNNGKFNEIYESATENLFVENHFNSFELTDEELQNLRSRPDSKRVNCESLFSGFESNLKKIIHKIIEDESVLMLTKDDKLNLANCIVIQSIISLNFRNFLDRNCNDKNEVKATALGTFTKDEISTDVKVITDNFELVLLTREPTSKRSFILSDNPVCFYKYDNGEINLYSRIIEFPNSTNQYTCSIYACVLPVSPNLTLCYLRKELFNKLDEQEQNDRRRVCDADVITHYNVLQFENSVRTLAANNREDLQFISTTMSNLLSSEANYYNSINNLINESQRFF